MAMESKEADILKDEGDSTSSPWGETLTLTPSQDHLANCMFRHYPDFGAVVCRPCKFVVLPREIKDHLEGHSRLAPEAKEMLLSVYESFYPKHEDISQFGERDPSLPPLSTLRVNAGGYKCQIDGCNHVSAARRDMKEHLKICHQISGRDAVQTFAKHNVSYQAWFGPQSGSLGSAAHANTYNWQGLFEVHYNFDLRTSTASSLSAPTAPRRRSRQNRSKPQQTREDSPERPQEGLFYSKNGDTETPPDDHANEGQDRSQENNVQSSSKDNRVQESFGQTHTATVAVSHSTANANRSFASTPLTETLTGAQKTSQFSHQVQVAKEDLENICRENLIQSPQKKRIVSAIQVHCEGFGRGLGPILTPSSHQSSRPVEPANKAHEILFAKKRETIQEIQRVAKLYDFIAQITSNNVISEEDSATWHLASARYHMRVLDSISQP